MKMTKIKSAVQNNQAHFFASEYDLYVGDDNGKSVYNIIPKGEDAPTTGYYDKEYICKVKHIDTKWFEQ